MLNRRHRIVLLACLSALPSAALSAGDGPAGLPVAEMTRDAPVSFEKDVLPVLSANCLACHNRTKAKADLVLETPTDVLKGGESGPAAVPGRAEDSLLFNVSAHRADPVMPPKGNKVAAANLTPEQLGLLKRWIDQGAGGTIGGGPAGAPARPTAAAEWQPVPAGLNAVHAVAVTPDGLHAACARGGEVHVYHLPTSRLVSRLTGHRDLVQSLAFSPDGGVLASGAFREVRLWRRPRDARRFAVTSASRGGVNAADASPDGVTLATGGADGVIRLWAADDGRPARELAGHSGAVTAVRYSPDGTRIASASSDKTLRVRATDGGATVANLAVPVEPAAVAWAGANVVAAAGGDAIVRVWQLPGTSGAAPAPPKELKGHEGDVRCLAAVAGSPGHLLSGGADGTVRRWDTNSGRVVRQVSHGGMVTAVAARPDGKRFASAGADGVVKLWDAEGKLVAEVRGNPGANHAAATGGRDVAFAASEVAFRKADVEAREKRRVEQVGRVKTAAAADVAAEAALAEKQKAKAAADAKKTEAEAKKVEADVKQAEEGAKKAAAELARAESARAAASDELRLAIKAAQGAADAAAEAAAALQSAGQEQARAEAEHAARQAAAAAAVKPVRALVFSPDNRLLAAAGEDGVVRTYAAETGAAGESFRGHAGAVAALAWPARPGAIVVSGAADGAVVAWDGAVPWSLQQRLGTGDADSPFTDRVTALDFSADGKLLATGGGVPSREGEAMLWDVSGGSPIRRFERLHSDTVLALDLSADGRLLATAAADRFLKVSDAATGRLVKSFEGHTGHVLGVAFQRTGRTLATGSADNTVKVWDLVAGEQRKTIRGWEKEVTSVRYLGDTDQFVATAGDAKVRLLRPDGTELRAFPGFPGFVYAAAASGDGSVVVAGGDDGTLRAWNTSTGELLATLRPPDAAGNE